MERKRGALHRHPPPVHHHRERGVNEQSDTGLRARLGLLYLYVTDLDPHTRAGCAALPRRAGDGVGDGAGDIPGFRVAEGPLAGGTGALPRRSRLAKVMVTLAARHAVCDIPQQCLAELSHRLRGQCELAVRSALHGAGVTQGFFELLKRAGVNRCFVAELAGQLVEIEVVQARSVVRLRKLLRQRVELGDVLEYPGAVAETEPLLAIHLLGAAPVLPRAKRAKAAVELGERLHQLR